MKNKAQDLPYKPYRPQPLKPLANPGVYVPKPSKLKKFALPTALLASVVVVLAAGSLVRSHQEAELERAAAAEQRELPLEDIPRKLSNPAPAIVARWEAASKAEESDPLGISGGEVAAYISRTYRVPMAQARLMTEWVLEVGAGLDVDPMLILAVVGTESSFNPAARSGAGAEGLMQVMTKVHLDKFEAFGGRKAALEPYPNLVVGTTILKSLIEKTGSVSAGLKWYCGAARRKTDNGYGEKVMKERSRLLVAALGDSDGALQLSRSKKNGPDYRKGIDFTKLAYSQWIEVSEAADAKHRKDLVSLAQSARPEASEPVALQAAAAKAAELGRAEGAPELLEMP